MIKLMDLLKEYEINPPPGKVKVINDGEDVMAEIEKLGLFNFNEGLLGSTGHGVGYYYHNVGEDARQFIGPFSRVKNELKSMVIDEDNWREAQNDNPEITTNTKQNFFKKYRGTYIIFSDYDNTNYGRIDVNPSDESITVYALPMNDDEMGILEFTKNGKEVVPAPNVEDFIIAW